LGFCFYHGKGVKQDYKIAFQLFHNSDSHGNCYGTSNLAICYFNGHGVFKNIQVAIEMFQKAIQMGEWIQFFIYQCAILRELVSAKIIKVY
jgi:TPR repeat protein